MGVPATLSSVPDVPPYIQYLAANGQTVYPYPFPITQDADLVVVINGVTQPTDSTYSVSGVGNSTGGNVTLIAGSNPADVITLYRDIQIERISQIAQNSGFSSTVFNNEFNNFYLIAQQLESAIEQCLQIPNTNNPAPVTLLQPGSYANKYLAFDQYGNPTPAALVSGTLTQSILGGLFYPRTPAEENAGVTPVNIFYTPGVVDRYGTNSVPGTTDMTLACMNCIAANDTFILMPGTTYAVTSITFPLGGPHYINFNGSWIRGIATSATNCIAKLEFEGTTVVDYRIDGDLSQNYLCGTWWYNATANSQYNTILSMKHAYLGGVQTASGTTVRAMIYGALVGQSSTGFAQSENQIYGWRTRGCQNPFYNNHNNGVLQFTDPIFVCVAEEWPQTAGTPNAPWSYANARTIEVVKGTVNIKGGEIQIASAGTTVAAELISCFLDDVIIEANCPIRINGDSVRLSGCRFLQDQLQPCFNIGSGATGILALNDMYFSRAAGVGAFDNNPIIDASGNSSAFEILFNDTESNEYRWVLVAADVRLVKLGAATTVRYRNHRMSMTAADPNVYIINTFPTNSLLEGVGFDRLGYTTTGWNLVTNSGSATMTATTSAGPTGYNAAQITLAAAAGNARACYGDSTSLTTLRGTALHVRPGELYWCSAQCNVSAGTGATFVAVFFDNTGSFVAVNTLADSGTLISGWKYVETPTAVPANAAYMLLGVAAINSTILVTDLRVGRAS